MCKKGISPGIFSRLIPIKEILEQLDRPTVNLYASLIRRCASVSSRSLADGRRVHDHIVRSGLLQRNIHLGNLLIQMYRKCGNRIGEARVVFDQMPRRDVVSWSSMIAAYAQNGDCREALALYQRMNLEPNEMVFVSSLAACSGLQDLALGRAIHSRIRDPEMLESGFVGTALVNMYAKCGDIATAKTIFDGMKNRDVVAWTTMITALAQNGDSPGALAVYRGMGAADVKPNYVSVIAALSACNSGEFLEQGQEIHSYVISSGMHEEIAVQNALISMFGKCRSSEEAQKIFQGMRMTNIVSWNSMIAAFAQNNRCPEAISLYDCMNLEGRRPDSITFLGVFSACSSLGVLKTCRRIHSHLSLASFKVNLNVQNAALTAFAKCGDLDLCEKLFDRIPGKNVVSWTSMLTAYAFHGDGLKALEVYKRMLQQSISPDDVALLNAVYACSLIGDLNTARNFHKQIPSSNLQVQIQNGLIHMYSNCGSIEDAREVFEGIREKNVASWNSMMDLYLQHGLEEEVIHLYKQLDSNLQPDCVMVVFILCAYAGLGELAEGRIFHSGIQPEMVDSNLMVGNALVSMYARCGSLADARQVFGRMRARDRVTWSSLIAGYSRHGYGQDAIELYQLMHLHGMQPDHVTFVNILNSCSHGGLLDEARTFFRSMVEDHFLGPWFDHYKCMVDVLGRAGYLGRAEALIWNMPFQPDFVSWNTLLGSCRVHGDVERGTRAAGIASSLDPEFNSSHILLSNIFAPDHI